MKVLLDACVWGGATKDALDQGHDAVWAGDWEKDPGDEEILRLAHAEGRVVVTLDKDFGEIAIVRGVAHSGIVRLVEVRARDQGRVLSDILTRYENDLSSGAIITVEPGRVRVRSGA